MCQHKQVGRSSQWIFIPQSHRVFSHWASILLRAWISKGLSEWIKVLAGEMRSVWSDSLGTGTKDHIIAKCTVPNRVFDLLLVGRFYNAVHWRRSFDRAQFNWNQCSNLHVLLSRTLLEEGQAFLLWPAVLAQCIIRRLSCYCRSRTWSLQALPMIPAITRMKQYETTRMLLAKRARSSLTFHIKIEQGITCWGRRR